MTGEILLKTINQGSRTGIPVVMRPKLMLNPLEHSSAANITCDTPAENGLAASVNPALNDTTVKTKKITVPDDSAMFCFDMELLTRLKNCNPALTPLTTEEVASIFRVSVKKLENDRYHKRGLPYVKISGTVRYRLSDILAVLGNAQTN